MHFFPSNNGWDGSQSWTGRVEAFMFAWILFKVELPDYFILVEFLRTATLVTSRALTHWFVFRLYNLLFGQE
jgi:hypothetical protein